MSVEDKLRVLSERIRSHSSAMLTEEAVKTAVVLPFLAALEYDVFDPNEVVPEFCADAVGKKGEKVDYGVRIAGDVKILIECKPITTKLDKIHLAQLYRYFSVTNAKFAILTNGRTFHFHTDLDAPNKLDDIPFLVFDLSDLHGHMLAEVKKFSKSEFDVDAILQTATRLKYISAIKKAIAEQIESPSDEYVKLLTASLQIGRLTATAREQFASLVKVAHREIAREAVQARLSSALAETEISEIAEVTPSASAEELVTTEEEKEGYQIVRAIVRDILKPSRVGMRDQKSYCGILVDNNNRKPLARLHFNRAVKYIGLFDGSAEERVKIDSLDEIYDFADRLRSTAEGYKDPSSRPRVETSAAADPA